MAKVTLNNALNQLSGRLDGWVYRQVKGKTVVATQPDLSERAPSPKQLARRDRFDRARTYAIETLADPSRRRVYEALAAQLNRRADRVLMSDFLTPPVVEHIELAGYHGRVGDVIEIIATDDIEVVSVTVVLRNLAGEVLEQGNASKIHGVWCYVATTATSAGAVKVTATARDRPGNETTGEAIAQV